MTTSDRDGVRAFLISRRGNVRPEQVALPAGSNRRVPGLRRGEVAMLANISVEYYSRMERGELAGVSDTILDAVAGALALDDAEREHLFNLAREANGSQVVPRRRRAGRATTIRPALQLILDSFTGGPAFVRNGRLDILA